MKTIKFGILLVLLGFMKKIASLGKKIKVKIPCANSNPFDKEEDEVQDANKIKPTQYLQIKKNEKSRKNLLRKSALISTANAEKNQATDAKDKDKINFNVRIGIVNKNGCAGDGGSHSETFTSLEENGVEMDHIDKKVRKEPKAPERPLPKENKKNTPEGEEGKELRESKGARDAQKKDLGMTIEPQKEFLKETPAKGSSSEIADGASEKRRVPEMEEASFTGPNRNLKGNGGSSAEASIPPSPSYSIAKKEAVIVPEIQSVPVNPFIQNAPKATTIVNNNSNLTPISPTNSATNLPLTPSNNSNSPFSPVPSPFPSQSLVSPAPTANQVLPVLPNNSQSAPGTSAVKPATPSISVPLTPTQAPTFNPVPTQPSTVSNPFIQASIQNATLPPASAATSNQIKPNQLPSPTPNPSPAVISNNNSSQAPNNSAASASVGGNKTPAAVTPEPSKSQSPFSPAVNPNSNAAKQVDPREKKYTIGLGEALGMISPDVKIEDPFGTISRDVPIDTPNPVENPKDDKDKKDSSTTSI